MNYTTQKLPKSQIEIKVTTPFIELEPFIKKAAILISEETDIEGFRRGKAPYEVVKNRFGEMAIYERAAELAVRKTYPEVIAGIKNQESKIKDDFTPIGQPEVAVTKLAPGNDLEYKIKLAYLPEIKLPDYKKIAKAVFVGKKPQEVLEEEISKTVDWIRESRSPLVTVARPAKKGDWVEIDFELRIGGVKIAGGDSRRHPLTLGQGKLLPGLEDELSGMSAGEEKKFNLSVPDEWRDKNLAGKMLEVKVKMNLVQEKQIPELTDEFAKNLGDFSSVEALRTNVKEGLGQEKAAKEKQRTRGEIAERIAQNAKMDMPEILIAEENKKMLAEIKTSIESMGMKWADYLLHLKKSEEEMIKGWREDAERRVKQALCLGEIARLEKIEPGEEEIKTRVNQYLAQFKMTEGTEKEIDAESLREYTKGVLRNEKVFEFLESK